MQEVKQPSKRPLVFYYIIALAILMILNITFFPSVLERQVQDVSYTTFMSMTYDHNIGLVQIEGEEITFTDKAQENIYKTVAIDSDTDLVQRVYEYGGELSRVETQPSMLTSILVGWVLPFLPLLLIGYFLNRRMKKAMTGGGDGMMFGMGGGSGAKMYVPSSTGIRFSDVAGEDEAKELLGEIVDFLHDPAKYAAIGARLPKGAPIEPLLYGGYSSISLGYIGLYEVTKLMKGVSHTQPGGQEFAQKVMARLRKACDDWKKETNIGFALYGTPAESLCYRFARIDKERFGSIPDVTDKGYYTNSYHVDVREHIDAFDKFTFESQFQKISTGGCISYVEIPNMRHNLEALKEVVKFIYDNIQYAEFNTKSDYCQCCGYDGEIVINDDFQWECPVCHNTDQNKMNVTRRTCGYLGENYWNVGKTKEIKSRVLHL